MKAGGLPEKPPRHFRSGRSCAAAALLEVIDNHHSLSAVLSPMLTDLSVSERRLASELTYGVLRWWPQLEAVLSQLVKKPLRQRDRDVHMLLLTGVYQALHLAVPDHVAVSQTAEAARHLGKDWAVGLVNGVLRRRQREKRQLLQRLEKEEAVRYAFPPWLLAMLRDAWPERWRNVADASNQRAPMSLRVNCRKTTRADYLQQLADNGIEGVALPRSEIGIRLQRPVNVDELPDFGIGAVSVQDGAAQLVASLMKLQPGMTVMDACAAPGGKTCHLLETEPGLADLVAVDIDAHRMALLEENLIRLDLNADVRVGDAANPHSWWEDGQRDRILLDAPCSGTGVIRRHPDIKVLRRPEDIGDVVARQRALLSGLWPLLKPGGMLVYATCSILPQENEQQLVEFLVRHDDAVESPISAAWGIPRRVGRQILTGEEGMDGCYYARLIKKT